MVVFNCPLDVRLKKNRLPKRAIRRSVPTIIRIPATLAPNQSSVARGRASPKEASSIDSGADLLSSSQLREGTPGQTQRELRSSPLSFLCSFLLLSSSAPIPLVVSSPVSTRLFFCCCPLLWSGLLSLLLTPSHHLFFYLFPFLGRAPFIHHGPYYRDCLAHWHCQCKLCNSTGICVYVSCVFTDNVLLDSSLTNGVYIPVRPMAMTAMKTNKNPSSNYHLSDTRLSPSGVRLLLSWWVSGYLREGGTSTMDDGPC